MRARLAAAVIVALSLPVACGDGTSPSPDAAAPSTSEVIPTSTYLPPSATTAPSTRTVAPTPTSAAPPVGASVMSPPLRACQAGEAPALVAYARDDGSTAWSTCQDGSAWRDLVGATETAVYLLQASSASGGPTNLGWLNLIAVDAGSGTEKWRVAMGGYSPFVPAGPVAAQGIVLTTLDDGAGHSIAGLDADSGEVRWRVAATTDTQPLASGDDVVVVRGPMATLSGFERATGRQLWSVRENARDAVVVDDVVVVAGQGPPVGLDIHSGAMLWQAASPPEGVPGRAGGGVLAWGGQDDPTSALDAATGAWLWSGKPGHAAYDNVWAVGDGAVFVVTDGGTVAYDLRSGRTRWKDDRGSYPRDEPWSVEGSDLFSVGEELAVFSTAKGARRWANPVPAARLHIQGLAAASNAVFVSFGEQMGD